MTNSCSVAACDKPHRARGFCSAHYERLRVHGDPLGGRTPEGEPLKFLETALSTENVGCLLWPFARTGAGYGQIWLDGRVQYVHRIVCEKVNGPPPTPKHESAHSCGNGHLGCITPAHLDWKTHAENSADTILHGTHNRGERCGSAKLTESDVREIRALRGTIRQREIASRFGVSTTTICEILAGRCWGWLGGRE